MTTTSLTLIILKSKSFWDFLRYGDYKDAAILWVVPNLAGRETTVVLRYSGKKHGWILGPELSEYKIKNRDYEFVHINHFHTPEVAHNRFMEMLGGHTFDNCELTPARGIARLVGLSNWKSATIERLISSGKILN